MAKKTSGRARIEEEAERLTEPVAEKNGVRIYDVEYVKEGSEYYLNIYIDKDLIFKGLKEIYRLNRE